jgi:hypothetical protein
MPPCGKHQLKISHLIRKQPFLKDSVHCSISIQVLDLDAMEGEGVASAVEGALAPIVESAMRFDGLVYVASERDDSPYGEHSFERLRKLVQGVRPVADDDASGRGDGGSGELHEKRVRLRPAFSCCWLERVL